MAPGGDALVLLLPERRRLAAAALDPLLARAFGRADRIEDAAPGETAQLQRHFTLVPDGWPMAALTRQLESGDADTDLWLRADPAFVRAEMGGARLMACGDLGFVAGEADDLLAPLRPLFGDAGMPISAGSDGRWYLRVARATPLPLFAPPAEALGSDVLPFLPVGRDFAKWRSLFNEAQVLLHHHPRNAARIAAGQPPVNALWFWGGGALPDRITTQSTAVLGDDFELRALAHRAGVAGKASGTGAALVDHRRDRDWTRVQAQLFGTGEAGPVARFANVLVDFADGVRYGLHRAQRWRVWRRSRDPLA
ncbi:MAG: phosphoglycerate mutase [Arenimonas sp.]